MPRTIGIGFVVDEEAGFEKAGDEETKGWRSTGWPFTVVAGADVLPAGELPDMGRTLDKERATGVVVRGMMICCESLVRRREEEEQDRAAWREANVVQTKGPQEEMFFRKKAV